MQSCVHSMKNTIFPFHFVLKTVYKIPITDNRSWVMRQSDANVIVCASKGQFWFVHSDPPSKGVTADEKKVGMNTC